MSKSKSPFAAWNAEVQNAFQMKMQLSNMEMYALERELKDLNTAACANLMQVTKEGRVDQLRGEVAALRAHLGVTAHAATVPARAHESLDDIRGEWMTRDQFMALSALDKMNFCLRKGRVGARENEVPVAVTGNTMTRDEWQALTPSARAAFFRQGGKIKS